MRRLTGHSGGAELPGETRKASEAGGGDREEAVNQAIDSHPGLFDKEKAKSFAKQIRAVPGVMSMFFDASKRVGFLFRPDALFYPVDQLLDALNRSPLSQRNRRFRKEPGAVNTISLTNGLLTIQYRYRPDEFLQSVAVSMSYGPKKTSRLLLDFDNDKIELHERFLFRLKDHPLPPIDGSRFDTYFSSKELIKNPFESRLIDSAFARGFFPVFNYKLNDDNSLGPLVEIALRSVPPDVLSQLRKEEQQAAENGPGINYSSLTDPLTLKDGVLAKWGINPDGGVTQTVVQTAREFGRTDATYDSVKNQLTYERLLSIPVDP